VSNETEIARKQIELSIYENTTDVIMCYQFSSALYKRIICSVYKNILYMQRSRCNELILTDVCDRHGLGSTYSQSSIYDSANVTVCRLLSWFVGST
jgi:hypothetical protein